MNETEETIEISKQEYKRLLERELMLFCLECEEVYTWERYDDAMKIFKEESESI